MTSSNAERILDYVILAISQAPEGLGAEIRGGKFKKEKRKFLCLSVGRGIVSDW